MKTYETVEITYDPSMILGVASLEDNKIRNLTWEPMKPLDFDALYIIPRQLVHDVKLAVPINGVSKSIKIFYLKIKEKSISIGEMAVGSLKATHFGDSKEFPGLEVSAAPNQAGLMRAVGAEQFPVFEEGYFPLKDDKKKHVYVEQDFAFRVLGRHRCWTSTLKKIPAGWSVETKTTEDGRTLVKLIESNFYRFAQETRYPVINLDDLGEKAKDLREMQKGL